MTREAQHQAAVNGDAAIGCRGHPEGRQRLPPSVS
jgi:hypothetical protein